MSAPGAADAEGLLALAVEAARMAGGLLAERARDGVERKVASKSTPTDLVSEADVRSQRAIRELLRERRPDDGFVGEEDGESEEGSSGLSWIVDPLDGTVNFLFQIPQWSVSVAVRDAAGTIAGAVFDPSRDELFCATRGGDALMRGPRGEVELAHRPGEDVAHERRTGEDAGPGGEDLASAMVATGLAYDADVRRAQARVLERVVPRVRDVRRFGSAALDLTWTACGRFDAYYERSVKQWDIAAGALVCERAGLEIHELPEHENLPWGILAAPPALAEALLELVSGP
ncbi:MAG TPA: inositol monophosphatase family protein [Solirubrobacteraceae bacterium]|jgi:myo-inositol-1(or 4)-monophosphatase|nr:inositol monophosphatase family protein [Solirubrobacteraceae bacterium]